MSSPFPPKKPTPPAGPPSDSGDPQVDAATDDQAQLDADNAAAGNPTPGSPQASLTATDQATLNDDWTKVAAWDVTDASGQQVTTLDGLAAVLGTDRTTAATMLLSSPMAASAPPELTAEANEEVSPTGGSLYGEFSDEIPTDTGPATDPDADGDTEGGPDDLDAENDEEIGGPDGDQTVDDEEDDDTPAFLKGKKGKALTAGTFVQLADGRAGRVELIASNGGRIPGVTGDVVGTQAAPAARVRLYAATAGKMLPTGQRIAVKTSQLRAQDAPRAVPAGDSSARLVLKVATHAGPAGSGKPTADAIREVYVRGKSSWPGETKTLLSADEWAMGRVDAFVQKAEGYSVHDAYVGDDDLLP